MSLILAACCKSAYATCEQVKESVMSAGICQVSLTIAGSAAFSRMERGHVDVGT